jgi:hypothetical protein
MNSKLQSVLHKICPFITPPLTEEERTMIDKAFPNPIDNYVARSLEDMVNEACRDLIKEQDEFNEMHQIAHKSEGK